MFFILKSATEEQKQLESYLLIVRIVRKYDSKQFIEPILFRDVSIGDLNSLLEMCFQ